MEKVGFRALVQQAADRAQADEAFRTALAADPTGTVERTFGLRLPSERDALRFRQRVLGRFGMAEADGQLDDHQLEAVSGGGCGCCWSMG